MPPRRQAPRSVPWNGKHGRSCRDRTPWWAKNYGRGAGLDGLLYAISRRVSRVGLRTPDADALARRAASKRRREAEALAYKSRRRRKTRARMREKAARRRSDRRQAMAATLGSRRRHKRLRHVLDALRRAAENGWE